MKKISALIVCLSLVCGTLATAQQDASWFDMKCGVCKAMSDIDGLLERVKCDTQIIDNGMITVTVVPDDMKTSMAAANEKMEAAIKRLMAGEHMELCGFCQSMGKLHQAGAKIDKYSTDAAEVMLITSDKPEVVDMIHAHATKTIAAKKDMMQYMKANKVSQR